MLWHGARIDTKNEGFTGFAHIGKFTGILLAEVDSIALAFRNTSFQRRFDASNNNSLGFHSPSLAIASVIGNQGCMQHAGIAYT